MDLTGQKYLKRNGFYERMHRCCIEENLRSKTCQSGEKELK